MNEMHAQPVAQTPRKWKAVYTIVDRGGDKKFWLRVGTAFVNQDESLNVKLDASPTNGQLHIRDVEPYNPAGRRSGQDSLGGAGSEATS